MNAKRRRPSTLPREPVRDILFQIVTEGPLHGDGQHHGLDAEPAPRASSMIPNFVDGPLKKDVARGTSNEAEHGHQDDVC
jgi:hypothetical protein